MIQKNNSVKKTTESRSKSLIRIMKSFRIYGLVYNAKQDILFYNDKPVKAFVDL